MAVKKKLKLADTIAPAFRDALSGLEGDAFPGAFGQPVKKRAAPRKARAAVYESLPSEIPAIPDEAKHNFDALKNAFTEFDSVVKSKKTSRG